MATYHLDEHQPQALARSEPWIAPNAAVIGRVHFGAGVSVWFGAVLRGDNDDITIGDNCNIQDGVVVHADPGFPVTLGADCTLGHRAIVHGCTVGDGSLIGMGAIVMNGAVIGAGSVVGAGAVVLEGAKFPERSLIVGAPARAIRTLPEGDGALRDLAGHYVNNAARFRNGLKAGPLQVREMEEAEA